MSIMRMTGFASGMDINQIVADLMRAERMPLDKMVKDRMTLEWRMEEYRTVNRKLDTFRNNILDNLLMSSKMLRRNVTSSNPNVVTATANSNVGNTSFQLSEIGSWQQPLIILAKGKFPGSVWNAINH